MGSTTFEAVEFVRSPPLPSPDRMDMEALARCSALIPWLEMGKPPFDATRCELEITAAAWKARAEKAEAELRVLKGLCGKIIQEIKDTPYPPTLVALERRCLDR